MAPKSPTAIKWPWWIVEMTTVRVLVYSPSGEQPEYGDLPYKIYPAGRDTVAAARQRMEDRCRKHGSALDAALRATETNILPQ